MPLLGLPIIQKLLLDLHIFLPLLGGGFLIICHFCSRGMPMWQPKVKNGGGPNSLSLSLPPPHSAAAACRAYSEAISLLVVSSLTVIAHVGGRGDEGVGGIGAKGGRPKLVRMWLN